MSKITIIEGNSNDKDNVRNFMVKGEKGADGVSPNASVTRGEGKVTINVTDAEGTTSADVFDGVSPTITTSKTDGTTTITITDIEGTKTATIKDGEVTQEYLEEYYITDLDIKTTYLSKNSAASLYKAINDFVVVTGSATLSDGVATGTVSYPTGFTKSNCVVISFMANNTNNSNWGYGYLETSVGYSQGAIGHSISLRDNDIKVDINNPTDGAHTSGTASYNYKIVLMKIS